MDQMETPAQPASPAAAPAPPATPRPVTESDPARWPDPPGATSPSRPAPSELQSAQQQAAESGDARDLAHYLELRRKP